MWSFGTFLQKNVVLIRKKEKHFKPESRLLCDPESVPLSIHIL